MPVLRFSETKSLSFSGSAMPTLKSPSVIRMTRLTAALSKALLGELVGERQALAAGSRTAGVERIDGAADLQLLGSRRRLEHGAGRAGIDDHRDVVLGPQLVDEDVQRLLRQRQAVRLVHRAGDVDQEDEVQRRLVVAGEVVALQADMDDLLARQPRATE